MMTQEVGTELTRAIKKRLDQIVAFEYFGELQSSGFGKMESLAGDMHGDYSIRVTANYRLIVSPKSSNRSAEALKRCDTLIIKGVVDYHGKTNKLNWLIP
jgi:proteic killer suppression protein/toxin YoeB